MEFCPLKRLGPTLKMENLNQKNQIKESENGMTQINRRNPLYQ